MVKRFDPTSHPNWLKPHSLEWYRQLSEQHGAYTYPWHSTLTVPNGESIFDKEVMDKIQNKKVLDVGCGHGEFALNCSAVAKEVIGFDITDRFIDKANENKKSNLSFVVGNSKHGLPFKQEEFDCAYIRKGPTSAYLLLHQVVKKGGIVLGLHPGDDSGRELPMLFPNLFTRNNTGTLHAIKQRLQASKFSDFQIETFNSIEYLHSPTDVIRLCCFGQTQIVYDFIFDNCIHFIDKIFQDNAVTEGLPITSERHIVRAII